MAFELPALPFDKTALDPHISANTLDFHHGKHHNAYVTNLNNLIQGGPLANQGLESIIKETAGNANNAGIFNNAAQIWNHTFYWNSMKPGGGGEPTGPIADAINSTFGSYGDFKEAFKATCVTQFGSGWGWLVASDGKVECVKTLNAETPLTTGKTPLITCDVWEHAYYLDFQNRRPDYVETFLDHLVNWDFANQNLANA